jgi:nucleoside-diphosphate-sugar epimerase
MCVLCDGACAAGKRERKWSWVHVDDLAQAYVLAVQKIHAAKGEVFNVASPSGAPTWEELNLRAAKLVGFTGTITYEVQPVVLVLVCTTA